MSEGRPLTKQEIKQFRAAWSKEISKIDEYLEMERKLRRLELAAPDLLAALKEVSKLKDWQEVAPSTMVRVEEAIRKAEGGYGRMAP